MRKTKIVCTIGPACSAEKAESSLDYSKSFSSSGITIKNSVDAVSHSTACMAIDTKAKDVFRLNRTDQLVIPGGIINGKSGNTNLIKLETI